MTHAENDNKPDYPYERDSKGQHVFFTFNPTSQLELRLGGHAIDQIAGEGRNRSLYAKLEYRRPLFDNIHLKLRHRSKRVQDDIPDPLYQYVSNPLLRGRYEIGLRDDPLRYRNSHAHLSYVKFDYTGIDHLTLNNTWRYELNHRLADTFDDGQTQNSGSDWSLALVNRVDYAWQPRQKLTLTPMLKWTYHRSDSALLGDLVDETNLAPIVRLDFFLTERTTIKAGIQGFPLLKHRFRDAVAPSNDFNAWHYIIGLQNNSSYTGYRISMNLGLRKSFADFVHSSTTGTVETSEFFLQVRTN